MSYFLHKSILQTVSRLKQSLFWVCPYRGVPQIKIELSARASVYVCVRVHVCECAHLVLVYSDNVSKEG